MVHISPTLPSAGDTNWAAPLNNALTTITSGVNGIDDRVGTIEGGYVTSTAAPELIRDTIGVTLVAGTNVTITPNDASDTITIASTGGTGGTDATRMKYRNTWTGSTVYAVNDVVTVNGSAYVSLTAHTSATTFTGVGTNWALLAQGVVVGTTAPSSPLVNSIWIDAS